MRKLLAYFNRLPQLTVVVVLFPIIFASYSLDLRIFSGFWIEINHIIHNAFLLVNIDCYLNMNPTIGQIIIVFLVLYTCAVSLISMFKDLRNGTLGIDLLAFVALLSTLIIGEFWASYLIVVMVWTGAGIEDFANMKAQKNLELLVSAAPKKAHLMTLLGIEHEFNRAHKSSQLCESYEPPCLVDNKCKPESCKLCNCDEFRKVNSVKSHNCSSCPFLQSVQDSSKLQRYTTVPVEDVRVGNVIIVLPGETVPVDGELLSGSAVVDTSAINGESVPRELYAGAKVLSGCVNGGVVLIMRVTKLSSQSQYQKIMTLVESARSSKAAVVRFADMLSVPFTVISFVIAGVAWAFSGEALRFAQVLVLATPCPLLIAVPVALMAGTGRAAKIGIVVKSQDVLEQLSRVTDVFFDKTGTLTKKTPQVIRVDVVNKSYDKNRIVMLAGVLETYSQHILAGGIAKAGSLLWEKSHPTQNPELPSIREYPVVHSVKETAGMGIQGVVDEIFVRVGRKKYVIDNSDFNSSLDMQNSSESHNSSESQKCSVQNNSGEQNNSFDQIVDFSALASDEMSTYVSFDGVLVGRIVLKDVPRDNAKATVETLRKLGVKSISMLTGDGIKSALSIANSVGIDCVHASLLPEDKLPYVKQHNMKSDLIETRKSSTKFSLLSLLFSKLLPDFSSKLLTGYNSKKSSSITMMVGDGVNDAPVLSAADIGVAITDGTDTAASECAQVVIMNNDIFAVSNAVGIAKRTKRVMLQSVFIGIGLAIISMLFAAFGFIPAVIGAMMQEIIDVISIMWALTALRSS